MLQEPQIFREKPSEEDFGLDPDPNKDASVRGRRMSFSDPQRPAYLPPDRDHAEVRDVGEWGGDVATGIQRQVDVFGRRT